MDNRYFDNVISEMSNFFDENGFKFDGVDVYSNDKKSAKIEYNEEKQMYILWVADIDEEKNVGEYAKVNAWLFDDSQNAKDAEAVGIDFVNSLRKELGIKLKRNTNVDGIDLPTAKKSDIMDINSFAKKMLDVFPTLKDDYKNHIAVYGNFLYLNFFGEYLVPAIRNYLASANKKQIKKFFDIFEDIYIKGDKDTINTILAVLTAVGYKNEKCDEVIKSALSDNTHFLLSYTSFIPVFAKNKKLLKAFIK